MNLFDALVIRKFLSHANIHVKCLDLGCLTHLNHQNLALLTENISCKGSEVIVEELLLKTSQCTIKEVEPLLRHSIFSNVVSLEL